MLKPYYACALGKLWRAPPTGNRYLYDVTGVTISLDDTVPNTILEALEFKMAQSAEERYSLRKLEHRLLRRSDNTHRPGEENGLVKNGETTPTGTKIINL